LLALVLLFEFIDSFLSYTFQIYHLKLKETKTFFVVDH